MPNNNDNHLKIYGSPEETKAIKELMINDNCYPEAETEYEKRNYFDLNRVVPMPEDLRNTTSRMGDSPEEVKNKKEYGYASWYDWSLDNWGTKWNTYETECWDGDKYLAFNFQTAWSPPMPVLLKLSDKFPDCVFILEATDEGEIYEFTSVIGKGKELDFLDIKKMKDEFREKWEPEK